MIPILYDSTEKNFTSNGIGRLTDAFNVRVEEVRNGIFELSMSYPITGPHYAEIMEKRYIASTHDEKNDVQPFTIYRISRPINGIVEINAHHISYAASDIIVRPISAESVAGTFAAINANAMQSNPFTLWTDNTSTGTLDITVPRSIRQILGGERGSVLDVFGGEYEFDKWTIKNHAARGNDNGVTIRYGKNLSSLKQTTESLDLYNSIVPYWRGGSDGTVVFGGVVSAQGVTTAVARAVDYSQEFDEQPTIAQLESKALSDLNTRKPWTPSENIVIDFVALWQTEEFKDIAPLERVSLCDTVTVIYADLGVQATAKVIRVVWDPLTERYTEIELGQARSTFADTILSAATAEAEALTNGLPTSSDLEAAIAAATAMITGGLGGYVVLTLDANGQPTEILIMDTPDKATAVNVWRWNSGGLGHSHSGYNGPFDDVAITQDGKINADMITAGTISANIINGGVLTLGGAGNSRGKIAFVDSSNNPYGEWGYRTFKVYTDNPNYGSKDLLMRFEGSGTNEKIKHLTGLNGITNESGVGYGFHIEDTDGVCYSRNVVQFNSTYRDHWNYDKYKISATSLWNTVPTNISSACLTEVYSSQDDATRYNEVRFYDGFAVAGGDDSTTDYFFYGGKNGFGWQPNLNYRAGYETTPGFKFDTSAGVFRVDLGIGFVLTMRTSGTNSGLRYNNNAIATSSSRRYKHDITNKISDELRAERLYDLPMKQFVYNDGEDQYCDTAGKTLPGFIAEEVAEIYPAAVIHKDGEIESWDERRILPGMLDLIQKQKKQLDAQAEKIDALEKRLAALEEIIGGLTE